MSGLDDLLWWLLAAALAIFVAAALAIPVSVLLWWAGWSRRARPVTPPPAPPPTPAKPRPGPFLVYFSGVGDISDVYQSRYEDELLAAIAERVPGLVVITDVFGFSVDNLSMTSQRHLGWFWTWVNDVRLSKNSPFKRMGLLIDLRNILHVSVSADDRYGPIYNYGVAEMTLQSLVRHGYVLGSGAPVALLGFSGGAQVALATAGYVQATLRAPVQVISLGGLMNANRSLRTIDRLTHFYGTADHVQHLPDWIFPARWPLFKQSDWNRAVAAGKIVRVCLGPMGHTKRHSYLDATDFAADGRSYRDVTADAIAGLLLPIEQKSGERNTTP